MGLSETAVLIDAGYLSELTKLFGNGRYLKLDISEFSRYLAIKAGLLMKECYYYTAPPFQGTPPSELEVKMKSGYDRFVSKLRKTGVVVREGRVQKIDGRFTQKGVDTLLVMDLMSLASKMQYKSIVLLACDSDFVPVIKKLEADKITIVLFYYTDRIRHSKFSMSNELLSAHSSKILLTKEYFLNNLQKDQCNE